MANSVEVRVPFLGMELVELLNGLSPAFKTRGGEAKWPIKRLLEKRFSPEFLHRKKIGFDFPLNDWIGDEHVDYLRQRTDLIDRAVLDATLLKYQGSHMRNRMVFSLVALALWSTDAEPGEWQGERAHNQAAMQRK